MASKEDALRDLVPFVQFTIWYHLYNFKNVKITHEGVLLPVVPNHTS